MIHRYLCGSEAMKPCARCKRQMHPAENCRREPDGAICMACYVDGPKILWFVPRTDDVRLN